jgi:hypothetical protein
MIIVQPSLPEIQQHRAVKEGKKQPSRTKCILSTFLFAALGRMLIVHMFVSPGHHNKLISGSMMQIETNRRVHVD